MDLNFPNGKQFKIEVLNYNKDHFYIKSATLNGKKLERNWLTHQEISKGGSLKLETAVLPNKKWGSTNPFITDAENGDKMKKDH